MLEKHLRLWSGLIVAAFVIPHLFNHSFGIFSLDALEAVRRILNVPWRSPLGGPFLFGAFLVHFLLALIALYRRPHLRMARWEAAQLILGLLVWPLLMAHAIGTRGSYEILGIDPTYPFIIASIWSGGAWIILKQSVLLLVVWGHLCVGLHFWLRLKPWYGAVVPILYPAVMILPVLAVVGFLRAGFEAEQRAVDPLWQEGVFAEYLASPSSLREIHGSLEVILLAVLAGLVALTLLARLARRAYRNRHGTFQIQLPDGRSVRTPVGNSVLEAIQGAGIEHAAVCGGRGRCTTCRVSVGDAISHLPKPEPMEARALAKIDAAPSIRLACQVRPRRDLHATPLLPPTATAAHGRLPGGVHGREQQIVTMFIDLRGSTRLGERRLPYDVLFILNLFFAEMTAALSDTDGHYAQFAGDGLMALYGLEDGVTAGSRQALAGAAQMFARLDTLNRRLKNELAEPLRMGIGIHVGEAIVGVMGPPKAPLLSAIGDNINIAARLESQTKEFDCPLVVSADLLARVGIDTSSFAKHKVTVKGREAPIDVFAISDLEAIKSIEGSPAPS
ncbi:MAG: 2Fe-2S iron-sulfur cluster binding domain-containing protein [Rhodospirillales bacterium]|jgi:adenylate cyclase|nr:2Fe-2S iron-sulfur cluster binding domain-containing protein [Rhodospirillales bacterium]